MKSGFARKYAFEPTEFDIQLFNAEPDPGESPWDATFQFGFDGLKVLFGPPYKTDTTHLEFDWDMPNQTVSLIDTASVPTIVVSVGRIEIQSITEPASGVQGQVKGRMAIYKDKDNWLNGNFTLDMPPL